MQLSLERIPQDLRSIFYNHRAAVDHFHRNHSRSAREVFRDIHLPLLLLSPFFYILSPVRLMGGGPFFRTSLLFPTVLMVLGLLLAMTFDRLSENADGPMVEDPLRPDRKNLALFLHLPVTGSGIFYFFHPAIGSVVLFASLIFSVIASVDAGAWIYHRSRIRSFNLYLLAIFLYLIPLLLLLAGLNMVMSFDILKDMDLF